MRRAATLDHLIDSMKGEFLLFLIFLKQKLQFFRETLDGDVPLTTEGFSVRMYLQIVL